MKNLDEFYAEINREIRAKKPIMAICYDFDKTLSSDDMQSFTLIPSFDIEKEQIKTEQEILRQPAAMFKMKVVLNQTAEKFPNKLTDKEKRELKK